MGSTRCAVCKYFRRRCASDCVFAPHFPHNDPQRFVCVHRIYGARNIGKMLEQLPSQLRGDAVESLYFEAKCRIQDPINGCVAMISQLHQQIHDAEIQLAKAKAQVEIAFIGATLRQQAIGESTKMPLPEQMYADRGLDGVGNSSSLFY